MTDKNTHKPKVVGHVPPKQGKFEAKSDSKTHTPIAQQERIKKKYGTGISIRQIAREEHKARETVSKIVYSPEMKNLEETYEAFLHRQELRIANEIVPALVHALKYSKDGGRLALELLERFGAIEPKQRLCPKCRRMW